MPIADYSRTISPGIIEYFSVTTSGTYNIYTAGAKGGNSSVSGGAGATVDATIYLTAGTRLGFVVGASGQNGVIGPDYAGGGGGGTFVFIDVNQDSVPDAGDTLLVAAGGGGGAGTNSDPSQNTPVGKPGAGITGVGIANASLGTAGYDGLFPTTGGNGGSDGFGGLASSPFPIPPGIYKSGGGAGWNANGGGTYFPEINNGGGGNSKPSFLGGEGASSLGGGDGGFGGGGGATVYGGGGGGGYNGGGGGGIYAGGGGGGSYLISTATLVSSVSGGNASADGAATLALVTSPINTIPSSININNYIFYNKILSGSTVFNSIAGDYCTANLISGSAYCGGINTLISTSALVSLCNPLFKNNGLISNGVQILPEVILNPIVINQFIKLGANALHYNYVAGLSYGGTVNLANNIVTTPYLTNVVVVNSFNNCSANVNMAAFEGIVISGSGVNVVGLTTNNNLIAGGNASYTFGDGNQIMCLAGGGAIVNGNNSINTIIIQGENYFPIAVNTSVNGANSTTQIWTNKGVSTFINCDYLQYNNTTIAISVGAGQAAGEAYRLYQAVFDRAPDKAGISYWIKQLENGASLESIANGFIKSMEFIQSYGSNVSNTNLINACYKNVLDRPADAEGLAYWVGRLSNGTSVAQVLAEFSESLENIQNVASLIGQGIEVQMA